MECVCGHSLERHTKMHSYTGPCMKCRCQGFSTEPVTQDDLPEVSMDDIRKAMADLEETTEELSHL